MQVDYFNIFPLITHNVQGHISHTHMYLILPIRQITFETFTRSISNLPIDCLYMFASSCVCHKNFHLKKKKKELPLVLSVRLKHGLVHFTRKKKKDSVLFSCAKFLSRSKIDLISLFRQRGRIDFNNVFVKPVTLSQFEIWK